tara:strand:+ start:4232 stop:5503 length:1272 start_codon:yes stop_codon:yes gene_type:complete
MNQLQKFQLKLAESLPFYYGWVILFSAGTAVVVRNTASALILSVFMIPMSEELGWSRTFLSGAATFGGVLAMSSAPFAGRLIDRYGSQIILSISVAILGATTLLIGWWATPMGFYLLFGIGRMLFSSPIQIGTGTVVSQWFIRRRGRANGFLVTLHSIGMGSFPLIAQFLISNIGWREAWFWMGIMVWIIALVPIIVLMVSKPEDIGLESDIEIMSKDSSTKVKSGIQETEEIWTVKEAIHTRTLWILVFVSSFMFFIHSAINIHQAAFLIDKGIDPMIAASALTMVALGTGIGGVAWGFIVEKINISYCYAMVVSVLGIVSLLYLLVNGPISAGIVALCFGLGLGGLTTVPSVAIANFYGRSSLGSIRGINEISIGGGQAAGAIFSGIIYDMTNSYNLVFPTLSIMALISALAFLFVKPPQK